MENIMNFLKVANSIVVAVCQFLAIIVISIGIVTDIGQLATIIAIRTILNYFLLHDIALETEAVKKSPRTFMRFFKLSSHPKEDLEESKKVTATNES